MSRHGVIRPLLAQYAEPIRSLIAGFAVGALCIALGACGDEHDGKGAGERAGEATDRAAERTGDAVKDGAEKTGEAVKDGTRKTGEAVERAGEKVQDASR